MKKAPLLLLAIILMTSCKSKLESFGHISVKNGEHKQIQISYSISHFDEFNKNVTFNQFKEFAETASSMAKSDCRYNLTYEPTSISASLKNDTVSIVVFFIAKNGFGVPSSDVKIVKFVNGYCID